MEKTLRHEQEGILVRLLRFMAIGGIIAYIPSVWASLLHGFLVLAVVDTLGYALVIVAAYNERFSFNAKLTVLVAVSILIGAIVLFYTGPHGAGYLWLVAAVVLSALFGRTRVVVFSIGISALVIVCWAVAIASGYESWGSTPLTIGIIGSNLLLICLALSIVIRLLIDRLGASILESRSFARRLETELKDTLGIKQDLEHSMEAKDALLRELHHRVRNNMQIVQSLLFMAGHSEELILTGRRVRALAMANDLSLASPKAPKVDVKALFQSLVLHHIEDEARSDSRPRTILRGHTEYPDRSIDPQLAGLLAIVVSDILWLMSTSGRVVSVSLMPDVESQRAEFRFADNADEESIDGLLSALIQTGLISGMDPDMRIVKLKAGKGLGAGLGLTFSATEGLPLRSLPG